MTVHEYIVRPVRDCKLPRDMMICDTPAKCAKYWRLHVETDSRFDPERECMVVLILNQHLRVKGHVFVSHGLQSEVFAEAREIYRAACITAASSIVCMHNHPSGDPEPSPADRRVTKSLSRAGEIIGIFLLDHIVIGANSHWSIVNKKTRRKK